jgi:hypothetical protein
MDDARERTSDRQAEGWVERAVNRVRSRRLGVAGTAPSAFKLCTQTGGRIESEDICERVREKSRQDRRLARLS